MLFRSHVDDADLVRKRRAKTFLEEVVDGTQKRRERLAGAGRRGDEGMSPVADRRPTTQLRGGRLSERLAEPACDEGMETWEHFGEKEEGYRVPCNLQSSAVMRIADGATWLKRWLSPADQRALVEQCRAIMYGPAGGYVPTVRGGGKMRVRMVCLGRHWNALRYEYEPTRADHDNAPVAPVPEEWVALASRIARETGYEVAPDLCIVNWYDADGRMGLHQDKDEGQASIEAGLPVVSISLGDTARFLFGGPRRRDPIESLLL